MSQASLFNLMPERRVWKVSELTDRIRDLLESAFFDIWVEGEVSNFRAAQSGHLYFTLKDAHAQIRCICFRDQARGLKFRPEDGLHVTVRQQRRTSIHGRREIAAHQPQVWFEAFFFGKPSDEGVHPCAAALGFA